LLANMAAQALPTPARQSRLVQISLRPAAGAATLAFPASPFTYTFPGASQTLASLAGTEALTNKDLTGAGNTFPTFNQNTTGSAAKWTTARNLAGNSVDGSANVAFANKFIVQVQPTPG
jgi:hypothetical protein